MTISYQFNVATASFAGFPKLLARWKGSVYKLVFKEVLVYACLYVMISAVYRCALDDEQKRTFEKLCLHMEFSVNFIPLTFVLGFYVSFVVGRWWDQFSSYPAPDRSRDFVYRAVLVTINTRRLCMLIILYVNGNDEKSRMIRRTLVRYLNASTVILTRSVSVVAKKRFPTYQHLVEAGLLTEEEYALFDKLEIQYAKFWIPLVWFVQLVDQTRKDGLFHDPSGGIKQVMDEVMNYRDKQGRIWAFDYVSVPIVYTQVVTLATYMYFVGCLFSRQFLDPNQKYENFYIDIYVPIFTLLQFFFYVGWLKVAESLINPWGEDDDDFDVNWFIDRHIQVSYAMVDDMYGKSPTLQKDKYWNEHDVVLPYTQAAMDAKPKTPNFAHLGSTMNLNIPNSFSPMRRPSVQTMLGSNTSIFLRKRQRKMSRQENNFAFTPHVSNGCPGSCVDIEIPVPGNIYDDVTSGLSTTADPRVVVYYDPNGYLDPGFPSHPEARNGGVDDRLRKISSPARTMFYMPDKDNLIKFPKSSTKPNTLESHQEEQHSSGENLPEDLGQVKPLLVSQSQVTFAFDSETSVHNTEK